MTAYWVLAPVAGRPGLVGGALRPATAADAPAIHALVTKYQEAGRLLPRTIEEIARHADRFLVISDGGAGAGDVLGCAELAPLSGGVAEVRSLVVDESEFDIRLSAPEGTTISAMDETLKVVEAEVRRIPGVAHSVASIGTSGIARVNSASIYVRLTDIESRTFSFGRLWKETLAGTPGKVFEGNFSQREKMDEIRAGFAKTCAV